ncbi:MAG: hypothetical protein AB1705_20475, partial [Verrucomicrobiota bacterium]
LRPPHLPRPRPKRPPRPPQLKRSLLCPLPANPLNRAPVFNQPVPQPVCPLLVCSAPSVKPPVAMLLAQPPGPQRPRSRFC